MSRGLLLLWGLITLLAVAAALWGGAVTTGGTPAGAPGAAPARQGPVPQTPAFAGTAIEPPMAAPDFTMADHTGRTFRLSEHRGRLVVLFFGYTHCPDVCPATLARFQHIAALLGDESTRVVFAFVTVDPERDTPERLAEYVSRAGIPLLALWAPPGRLEPVLRSYGVYVERVPDSSPGVYWINHTAGAYVIDQAGRLRLQLPFGLEAQKAAADLRLLLQEGETGARTQTSGDLDGRGGAP